MRPSSVSSRRKTKFFERSKSYVPNLIYVSCFAIYNLIHLIRYDSNQGREGYTHTAPGSHLKISENWSNFEIFKFFLRKNPRQVTICNGTIFGSTILGTILDF